MITSNDSYLDLLYRVQDPNRQTKIIPLQGHKLKEEQFKNGIYYIKKDFRYILATEYDEDTLYYNEPIYYVDLDKRHIEAPQFLSVEYDHNSETIYFCVDRFFDNIDLSTMFCVIQYTNANPNNFKNGFIYAVPYFDITTMAAENKMLFQWVIEGPATAYSGVVTFSIKFYKMSSVTIDHVDGTSTKKKVYDYVLNTQSASSKVLHGLDIQLSEDYIVESPNVFEDVYQALNEVARKSDIYWITLDDNGFNDPNFNRNEIALPDYPEETVNKNEQITNLITQ